MYKLKLIYKNELLSDNDNMLKNVYCGLDAKVLSNDNEDDGIVYIKNFPKDTVVVVDDNTTYDELKDRGFNLQIEDVFKNNIIVKKVHLDNNYIVQPLDTIDKICQKFKIDKRSLIEVNGLKSERLFVGQQLII